MDTGEGTFSNPGDTSGKLGSRDKSPKRDRKPPRASESWLKALDEALSPSPHPVVLSLPGQGSAKPADGSAVAPSQRYKIIGLLGRGASARLYRAWDESLRRPVALKVLDDASLYDVAARYRFQREAFVLATLRHPNVVTIYDQGETEGHPYLVMELVEGLSLKHHLQIPFRRSRPELLEIFVQAARGVGAAHALGVVHRDLKPEHVLITPEGRVKVCDFGIAMTRRTPDSLTRPGTILGTPVYMAPEQAKGASHESTPQTDVYSLGCILYEMLTGRPPFNDENVVELFGKVIRDDPPRPRKVNASLPRALEAIVEKAMAKDPEERYLNADALADDIRRYVEGRPILAKSPSVLTHLCRAALRQGRRLIPLTAAVILGGLSGAWAFSKAHDDSFGLSFLEKQAAALERSGNTEGAYYAFRFLERMDPTNGAAREGILRMKARLPQPATLPAEDRGTGASTARPRSLRQGGTAEAS